MKKVFLVLMILLRMSFVGAQSLSGSLVDEKGAPVSFANVVLLVSKDSAFVQGTISDESGKFKFADTKGHNLIRISCLGYATIVQRAIHSPLEIVMHEDTQTLEEVTVKGHRPAYKLTNEGLQTHVQGTALSKLGTAEDVLAHVPGMQKKDDSYEVFGKGTPIIYINGRQVRDLTELDQLKSEEIKSIELITNPGVKYDASVKAIVKITTKSVPGEGFSFDVRSVYGQWEYANFTEQLNWKYRHKNLDLFGTFYYREKKNSMESTLTQDIHADTLWHQDNKQQADFENKFFHNTWGINYLINDSNSIGLKYTLKAYPDTRSHTWFATDMTADGQAYDHIENTSQEISSANPSHLLNAYYQGKIGKTEIDFNADYLYNKERNEARYDEDSENKDDRIVTSFSKIRNELFAAKLVVSYPLSIGNLAMGIEYSKTRRNDDYINPEGYVPTLYCKLAEQHINPFFEYRGALPIGEVSVGARYEWVNFNYYENGMRIDEQSRKFGNLFPSISWGKEIGEMQLQLGYTVKTRRPSYQQLSNNVSYANRFTYQSGNPKLKHEVVHNVSLAAVWRFIQFSADYNDRRNAIIYWGEQVESSPSTTLISFKNLHSLKSVSALLSLSPKFGIWSPQLNIGMEKQWLDLPTSVGLMKMNIPVFMGSLDNVLNCRKGWVISVNLTYQGKGDMENCSQTRNVFCMDASIIKSFLNDKLSVKLSGTDLFHGQKTGNRLFYNRMSSHQIMEYNSREVSLTIRYKFNTTRNKYKGTGAANDEFRRL